MYMYAEGQKAGIEMERKRKLNEWINDFNEGQFDFKDVKTQIKAGWYDWFCQDSSLANKTKRMGQIIKQFKAGGKVDLETSYVWFKNNCPLNGPLYDDFRIADIESDVTLMVIQLNCPHSDKTYSVSERLNHFEKPIFETDSSRELIRWINQGWK
jgi:hypothetical protein